MSRHPIPIIIALLLHLYPLAAQTEESIPDGLETELEGRQTTVDGDELSEILDRYRRNPIDLSTTTAEELARLPGITLQQAAEILRFVDTRSPDDISQLEAIEWMTPDRMAVLQACTRLSPPAPVDRRLSFDLRSRVETDLQPRRGYIDQLHRTTTHRDPRSGDSLGLDTIALGSPYRGDRHGISTRLGVSYGEWAAGITFQKDPGESIIVADTSRFTYGPYEHIDSGTAPGTVRLRLTAFLSGYIGADLGPISFCLGDYSAEFGQGLLLWGGYGGYKGGNATTATFKSGRGIVPYRSTGEARFFRGGAFTLRSGNERGARFEGTIFTSFRSLDASLHEMTLPNGDTITEVGSIRTDGYRRTYSEIRRSGNLDETLVGGNVRYLNDGGHAGFTWYTSRYGHPIGTDEPHELSGDRMTMIGIDGACRAGTTWLYGEIARSTGGAIAIVGGATGDVAGIALDFAGRYIPADFHTPHGTGFGESPVEQHDEQGVYIGLRATVAPKTIIQGYFDLYGTRERGPTLPFPGSGVDGMLQCQYAPSPRLRLAVRLREETARSATTFSDAFGRAIRRLQDRTATGGRVDLEYSTPGDRLRLRVRFERRHIAYSATVPAADGALTYLDLQCRPTPSLRLGCRVALFGTDGYDARIYEFESDLPGRLASVPLYGEGRRFVVAATWRPAGAVAISFSYAETIYSDRTAIGSGSLQEHSGRVDNTMAVQIDVRL